MESSLENIGLSRQEAQVYINTLKLGVAKASIIAQKSGIKREGSYYILKTLIEKGFISEVIKSGVKYYNAIPPKRIIGILEEEKKKKEASVKEVLSELESLQKMALKRPKIEVYEGTEGSKTAASKILEHKNKEVLCYIPESILHFIPYFHPQFRRKRKENKVRIRAITEKTKMMQEMKKEDKKELRQIKFNDELISGRDSAFYILPNALLILKMNEKDQLGVYIEDESTAKLHKKIFEAMWKNSK